MVPNISYRSPRLLIAEPHQLIPSIHSVCVCVCVCVSPRLVTADFMAYFLYAYSHVLVMQLATLHL